MGPNDCFLFGCSSNMAQKCHLQLDFANLWIISIGYTPLFWRHFLWCIHNNPRDFLRKILNKIIFSNSGRIQFSKPNYYSHYFPPLLPGHTYNKNTRASGEFNKKNVKTQFSRLHVGLSRCLMGCSPGILLALLSTFTISQFYPFPVTFPRDHKT